MWFVMSLLALLFWSGSDIFTKVGAKEGDLDSHLKISVVVGFVMGFHALAMILSGKASVTLPDLIRYLPASALYILSMVIGYLGLRYIELSVSSPICNCSGAFSAILCLIFLHEAIDSLQALGIILVTAGVFMLGVAESKEDEESRRKRQELSGRHYRKDIRAFILPIVYCLLDTLGTFADSAILVNMDEDTANCAYELTWFACAVVILIYLFFVRKARFSVDQCLPMLSGALCETAGQTAYVKALNDNPVTSAPIISSYCVLSCVWAALFLKERLSRRHYIALLFTIAGIVVMGFCE
ncbi:MAG: DMT family transporter [Oscillospiraceae bacterium]|nr:DMT family transporter [Oscillospiraceae bacterium]